MEYPVDWSSLEVGFGTEEASPLPGSFFEGTEPHLTFSLSLERGNKGGWSRRPFRVKKTITICLQQGRILRDSYDQHRRSTPLSVSGTVLRSMWCNFWIETDPLVEEGPGDPSVI